MAGKKQLIKNTIIICLIVIILSTCACSINYNALLNNLISATENYEQNIYEFTYVVSFEYEELSDDNIIEQRLTKSDFTVKEKTTSDNVVTYTLERYYKTDDKFFSLLCVYENVPLLNKHGEEVLSRSDVYSFRFHKNSVYITVSDEVYTRFSTVLVSDLLRFELDDEIAIVMQLINKDDGNNNIKLFMHDTDRDSIDKTEEIYLKGVFNLASDPLKGKVYASVIQKCD